MAIGHADSADDRPDDTDESLIGSAQENIGQMGRSIKLFVRRPVDGSIVVPGEPPDRFRGKYIGVDNVATKVGHESHGR